MRLIFFFAGMRLTITWNIWTYILNSKNRLLTVCWNTQRAVVFQHLVLLMLRFPIRPELRRLPSHHQPLSPTTLSSPASGLTRHLPEFYFFKFFLWYVKILDGKWIDFDIKVMSFRDRLLHSLSVWRIARNQRKEAQSFPNQETAFAF